ncbi:MAG: hypothetical protein V8Q40_10875 [Anaerosacchariphilus sp.]
MMTTLHRQGNGTISYTKGSPDVILKRCDTILEMDDHVLLSLSGRRRIERLSTRSPAGPSDCWPWPCEPVIPGPQEKSLTFLGLAGMMDPVRPEAVQAVQDFARQACGPL